MKHSAELKLAFKNSIPVMMGYLVLGFGMGILMSNIGLEWYWVVLMSLVVYAGLAVCSSRFPEDDMGLTSDDSTLVLSSVGLTLLMMVK